jgi:DNA-binding IclR family transcriptional regulator
MRITIAYGLLMKAVPRAGTQSIERTLRLLRLVSSRRGYGWRLTDLAEHSGLSLSTASRLVGCLIRERYIQVRRDDRHYVLGPALFELSLCLNPAYSEFLAACNACLMRISRQESAVVYVMIRNDTESVCIARQGTFEHTAVTVEVGSRRPLISTAGGLAILISLGASEMNRVLKDNRDQVRRRRGHLKALDAMFRESQQRGFGIHSGVYIPGVQAIGVALRDRHQAAFGSISLAILADHLSPSRTAQFAKMLNREAAQLSERFHELNVAF